MYLMDLGYAMLSLYPAYMSDILLDTDEATFYFADDSLQFPQGQLEYFEQSVLSHNSSITPL
jgi:hypothetical protein